MDATDSALALKADLTACRHCGRESAGEFCCPGCAIAYRLIGHLGLDAYYRRRRKTPPRPEAVPEIGDLSAWIRSAGKGRLRLSLLVDGLECGACLWLIEQSLQRQKGVIAARLSLATRRLALEWREGEADPRDLVALVQQLGYRLLPATPETLSAADREQMKILIRSLAVAGFAAGNIMLLSVAIWAGHAGEMEPSLRDLLHWLSAAIAIPAILYAGRPFFRSAFQALRRGRTNMDVPISLAVILAPSVSLIETLHSGEHAYFDSAITLLFFLLIGRLLDHRARYRARALSERLLALNAAPAQRLDAEGKPCDVPASALRPGDCVLIAAGKTVPADGRIAMGESALDLSLVTGEALPQRVRPGDLIHAGAINLAQPLRLTVTASGEDSLLAEIIRLMEAAEAKRGAYLRLADRVARAYAPVVHVTALASFLFWWLWGGMPVADALLIAIAVLIITCPCALALAIPVVQVVASQRLMKSGLLLKSGDALERLRDIDIVVFDKTGTLTMGRPQLIAKPDPAALRIAAGIAANSRHPLSLALARAGAPAPLLTPVEEVAGHGLLWHGPEGDWKLGSAAFVGLAEDSAIQQRLWLADPAGKRWAFDFADSLRPDAAATIAALKRQGLKVEICSGDRTGPVAELARQIGIGDYRAEMNPAAKVRHLEDLARAGHRVLMVGDGLNDAAALAAARVSLAPAGGADISQAAADLVFQGESLRAVLEALAVARSANRLMRQNLALALTYNLAAVPLAVMGEVTPLVAAIAMSSSSVIVTANALRLAGRKPIRP